jgi:hypothetical protein
MIDQPDAAPASPSPNPRTPGEEQWQAAQERVLRYLKALGVAPVESLETTLQVLRRASSASGQGGTMEPVREAMRVLRQMLEEKWPSPLGPRSGLPSGDSAADREAEAARVAGDGFPVSIPAVVRRQLESYGHVRVAPPLKRGVMRTGQVKP